MCGGGGRGSIPPPPPLPPPPPPPAPPQAPVPAPEPVVEDVNPQVRRAKSKKARNPYSKGTGDLRIPLKPTVNPGAGGGSTTGVNP